MNISIFAKNPKRVGHDHHLQRVSSIIRGQQIVDYIGAKLNPTENYQDDVCIFVKPHVKPNEDFNFPTHSYLDVIDGTMLIPLLQKHPEVTAIACSYSDFEYISSLVENKVLLIPQHNCNFERQKRNRGEIKTVGVIGGLLAFNFLPNGLKEKLKERNIELVEFSNFQRREDIVNFYMNIDVQIVWRPYVWARKIRLSNPLKLVNSASFGVPTITLPEPAFRELGDCYITANNLEEFLESLDALIDSPALYNDYSQKCIKVAEKYHIQNIAKLYTALK